METGDGIKKEIRETHQKIDVILRRAKRDIDVFYGKKIRSGSNQIKTECSDRRKKEPPLTKDQIINQKDEYIAKLEKEISLLKATGQGVSSQQEHMELTQRPQLENTKKEKLSGKNSGPNWALRIVSYIGLIVIWIIALGILEDVKGPLRDYFMNAVYLDEEVSRAARNYAITIGIAYGVINLIFPVFAFIFWKATKERKDYKGQRPTFWPHVAAIIGFVIVVGLLVGIVRELMAPGFLRGIIVVGLILSIAFFWTWLKSIGRKMPPNTIEPGK